MHFSYIHILVQIQRILNMLNGPLNIQLANTFFFMESLGPKKEARLIPAHIIDVYYPLVKPEYLKKSLKNLIYMYIHS